MVTPVHFGWFLAGYRPGNWLDPRAPSGYRWTEPELYQDMARHLEKAHFDVIVVADMPALDRAYRGSIAPLVRHGLESIDADPVPLITVMAAATERIGVAATLSTTFYPPFLLARMVASLDHITKGRVGWNVVTTGTLEAAANFGYEETLDHDERYDRADEFLELCYALWDSWEPDAVVMDRASGTFADPAKVHEVNFRGKYFSCRGPLTIPAGPQGRPTIVQAGGSPRGREFASRHADMVLANRNTVASMKEYRDDIRSRAARHGRDPDSCKVFFSIKPIMGETEDIARARYEELVRLAGTQPYLETGLAFLSGRTGIDFAQFPLDEPFTEEQTSTKAGQSLLPQHRAGDVWPTPRQIAEKEALRTTIPIVGSYDQVADQIGEIARDSGADGFLIREEFLPAYVAEIADCLMPRLADRGLVRTTYAGPTLRDNLTTI